MKRNDRTLAFVLLTKVKARFFSFKRLFFSLLVCTSGHSPYKKTNGFAGEKKKKKRKRIGNRLFKEPEETIIMCHSGILF